MTSSLKDKTVKGVLWSSLDRFSTQGIQFVFGVLIARLLLPSDYGIIAMLGIFMAVSQSFIDSGFGTALIRKLDRTQTDFSTVFYFNIVVAIFAYTCLWIASPYIAEFYNIPLLESVTKVVGLNLVVSSFVWVQHAQLMIKVDFKTTAKISVCSALTTGIVGLTLAYNGYGVWALVFQTLSATILKTILYWIYVRWIPSLVFSWKSFKELFSFGSKILVSAIINTIYCNIYTLVIGKFFSSSALGYYSRADGLAQFPSSNMTGILQSVTFPVLSTIQNDDEKLSLAYKRFIRMSAFVVFPLMVGLSAVADPFIRLVLTDKWAGTIYLLQIICFAMMWYPVHAINLNLLMVKGRTDYYLRLEIIKKILGIVILCITIPMGLIAMCYGEIINSILCLVLNTHYTKKLINYSFWQQIRDLLPILIQSLIMGGIVYIVINQISSLFLQLFIGILIGMLYYIASSKLLRFKEFDDIISILKHKKNNN